MGAVRLVAIPVAVEVAPPATVVAVATIRAVAPLAVPIPVTGGEGGRQLRKLPISALAVLELPLLLLEEHLEQRVVAHASPGRRLGTGGAGGRSGGGPETNE